LLPSGGVDTQVITTAPDCSSLSANYIGNVSAPSACDVCGFRWADVTVEEIPSRLDLAIRSFADIITSAGPEVARRPSPTRWSILEYGGHMRDVLISIRERIIIAAILDAPTGVAMNREERVSLGLYQHDTPADVAVELSTMTNLFIKTIRSLSTPAFLRHLTYSAASPYEVTILWAAAQAVHEAEHHLDDVKENVALLA
jgi:hypothetical protein